MASVTQAADRHTAVTTGWSTPTNAYSTTGDNVYATAAPGKNLTVDGDFGFPALSIPAGSPIVSVAITVEWGMTASVTGGTLGIQGRNNNVADATAEVTKTTTAEAQSTFTFGTVPSAADLLTAGRVVARIRCTKGNSSTAMTGNLDFVSMAVTYLAAVTAPTASVITGFPGADEAPLSEAGAWPNVMSNGQGSLRVVSNTARVGTTGSSPFQRYYGTTQHSADGDVFATLPATTPNAAEGLAVWGRCHNPNDAATMESYLYNWEKGTGHRLYKVTSGSSFAQLGSTIATPDLANGDKICVRMSGTTISGVFYQTSTTTWYEAVSATDSAIAGVGYGGLEIKAAASATVPTFDDFGMTVPSTPSAPPPTYYRPLLSMIGR